ncbi:MAG: hypothetical protein QOI10_1322 [Solirubrobacterales bacterium]|jgi:hypothetical protein|nr:hypothetical protein [Solirubrobacterales bacterium]
MLRFDDEWHETGHPGSIQSVLSASENRIAIALVAVMAAPAAGFLAMGVAWKIVTSDGRGGMDVGVMLIGAAVAALFVGFYARWQSFRLRSSLPWLVGAFLLTFGLAFGVVWLFYAGPFSFDFSAMD